MRTPILVLVTFFAAAPALASEQCAGIVSDAERLFCYDSIYRDADVDNVELSPDAAFRTFHDLAAYEGKRGWRQFYLDRCVFYDHMLEYTGSPPHEKYCATLWQLRVDLKGLQAEKLAVEKGRFVRLVMERGNDLINSRRDFQNFRGSYGHPPLSFSPPENIPRSDWDALVVSTNRIAELYPKIDTSNMMNGDSFKFEAERSVSWSFDDFWPEDRAEINEAFIALARVCAG